MYTVLLISKPSENQETNQGHLITSFFNGFIYPSLRYQMHENNYFHPPLNSFVIYIYYLLGSFSYEAKIDLMYLAFDLSRKMLIVKKFV